MTHIYTDAAYDYDTKVAGWAYYIESDREYRAVGTVTNVICPIEAELIAIRMAVGAIDNTGHTLFWSDCWNACSMLIRPDKEYNHCTKHRDFILNKLKEDMIVHYFNYLPRNSTPQHLWCDKQSKLAKLCQQHN